MRHFASLTVVYLFALVNFAHAQHLNNISSYLTIYVYPPRTRIDWSTPKTAASNMINMEIKAYLASNQDINFVSDFGEHGTMSSDYRSTMGHTIGYISCLLPNGQRYTRWTSFTGQNYGKDDRQKLTDKLGAGLLFYEYIDGEVLAGAENPLRITYYNGETTREGVIRPRYLQLEVTPKACADLRALVTFFEGFHHPPMSLDQLEQLPESQRVYFSAQLDPFETYLQRQSDPYARVGGGCAPYGAALIKMSGRYQPEFETFWRRSVTISERLIGGVIDPYTGRMREVTIEDITKGPLGDSWIHPRYDNRYLSLYDPQLIWDFVGHLMHCSANPGQCNYAVSAWLNAQAGLTPGQQSMFRSEKFNFVQPVQGMVWRLSR